MKIFRVLTWLACAVGHVAGVSVDRGFAFKHMLAAVAEQIAPRCQRILATSPSKQHGEFLTGHLLCRVADASVQVAIAVASRRCVMATLVRAAVALMDAHFSIMILLLCHSLHSQGSSERKPPVSGLHRHPPLRPRMPSHSPGQPEHLCSKRCVVEACQQGMSECSKHRNSL